MHGPNVRRVAVAVHERVPGVRLPVQRHRDHGPLLAAPPDHPRLLLGGLAAAAAIAVGVGVGYCRQRRRRLPVAAAAAPGDYCRYLYALGGRCRLRPEGGARRKRSQKTTAMVAGAENDREMKESQILVGLSDVEGWGAGQFSCV